MRVTPSMQAMTLALGALVGLCAAAIIGGCATTTETASNTGIASAADAEAAAPTKGGAELWGQSCAQCHNLRSPSEFNDPQWALIVHHMRLQANLTGSEQRTISEFLKSAN
jgi:mono/diheme cytochrome c family protein